jgi:hypothetical protein
MTPLDIIRAVNAKAITVRAALQLIGRKKEQQPEIPGKIKVLEEHIRQELG